MIVLDTNVVSELLKLVPQPAVLDWLDRQVQVDLYLASTSLGELLAGLAFLPPGKRKTTLSELIDDVVRHRFANRILPFDRPAALIYAAMVAKARAQGRAIGIADGQIAAVAARRGFSVATRDTIPFVAAGVPVINPWLTAP